MWRVPRNRAIIWALFSVGTILYFLLKQNSSLAGVYAVNYMVIVGAYAVCCIVFGLCALNRKIMIFEPMIVFTFIYFFMFVYYPLEDINEGVTTFFGQDITAGTIKATLIVMFSYIAFLGGYYLKKSYHVQMPEQRYMRESSDSKRKIFFVALALWLVGLAANFFYIMSSGKSLAYILSLGAGGVIDSDAGGNGLLGFVGMFGFLMIGSWFYIKEYGRSRSLKIVTYLLTLLLFWVRGFRFVIVIILVSPIVFYFVKRKKNPSPFVLAAMLVVLLSMITVVGIFRNDIRHGTDTAETSDIGLDTVEQSLYENFGQYRPFYIMVEQIPENYSYTYGVKSFVNPLIMFIPRIVWRGKRFLGESSNNFLSRAAQIAGSAYCNLGELYMDFGAIGCVIAMFFVGRIFGWTKKWIHGRIISDHSLFAYSVLVPLTMQLIIRGYMASNFNLILFCLLPIWICSKLGIKEEKTLS